MNESELKTLLTAWHQVMLECDQRMDQLAEIVGSVIETPLGDAVYHLMGQYTELLADKIGWDADTLTAWWCENDFGNRPMRIGFRDESLRTIETIDQLAEFIAEYLRRSCQP